jgi:hypothetical protein
VPGAVRRLHRNQRLQAILLDEDGVEVRVADGQRFVRGVVPGQDVDAEPVDESEQGRRRVGRVERRSRLTCRLRRPDPVGAEDP